MSVTKDTKYLRKGNVIAVAINYYDVEIGIINWKRGNEVEIDLFVDHPRGGSYADGSDTITVNLDECYEYWIARRVTHFDPNLYGGMWDVNDLQYWQSEVAKYGCSFNW